MATTEMDFAELDELCLTRFRDNGFSPNCILDIGASNGSWSRKIVTIFPEAEFHLFEPLADHVEEYRTGLCDSLATHSNFHLHKVSVGTTSESKNFYRQLASPYGSTSLTPGVPDNYQSHLIQAESLDTLVKQQIMPIPDLIKIDIQGGELEALQGCENLLPKVEVLLLETWLSRGYGKKTPLLSELIQYLETFDFHVCDFSDCYRNESQQLIAQDVFFAHGSSNLLSGYSF